MVKEGISAKIERKLKIASKNESLRRGITFSRLVEVALIHELNGTHQEGLLTELVDIQDYVAEKIKDLSVVSDSDLSFEVRDAEYYVNELKKIHERYGRVSPDVVSVHAKKAGLSMEDMMKLLNECEYQFKIL